MIVAIYARKSTDQSGVAEEARSVTLQVDAAQACARSAGWTVPDDLVFTDAAISGAEFGARRPGLMRLLAALKPRPIFSALLVTDRDRIGREQIETAFTLKQLVTAGVRVFEVKGGEPREIRLDSPTEKVVSAVLAFAGEQEREQARVRTRAALERRARAGHVAGGACFGFDNREVRDPEGRRLHVERVVNEAEAATVRRIFEAAAGGLGFKRIAGTLNAAGVVSPRPRTGGHRSWTSSSVRTILFNETYRGRLVWGRRRKRDAWGQRRQSIQPSEQWVEIDAPHLRIVPEVLWEAAHLRIAGDRGAFGGKTPGGRPVSGTATKYLLTGLGSCAWCGGGIVSATRDFKAHGRRGVYLCGRHRERGTAVCANRHTMPMVSADHAVLDAIERDLLRPPVVEYALNRAIEMFKAAKAGVQPRQDTLRAEIARLQGETSRLAEAIALGKMDSGALLAALQERERRLMALRAELTAMISRVQIPMTRVSEVREQIEARLASWRSVLRRQATEARQIIRTLLVDRLVFTPQRDERGWFYAFAGTGSVSAMLSGIVDAEAMVTPAGFEPAISTLKGSRPGPG